MRSALVRLSFHFKQTGAHFRKDRHLFDIPRKLHYAQAYKAGLDTL